MRKLFESRIAADGTEKLLDSGDVSAQKFDVFLRHGRTCEEMRGTTLRIGNQKHPAVV